MAANTIRRIFLTPTVAIARLGASTTPLDAFEWAPGDPHTSPRPASGPPGRSTSCPTAASSPDLPQERRRARRRPSPAVGPVPRAVGDGRGRAAVDVAGGAGDAGAAGRPTGRRSRPHVHDRRHEPQGGQPHARRPGRRRNRPLLRYGTFPPVRIAGNDHAGKELLGISPPDAARPMIPRTPRARSIPLGRLQVLRPVAQPANPPWPAEVRIDAVRVRFTPAPGRFYGPPAAAQARSARSGAAGRPRDRAFLDRGRGLGQSPRGRRVIPPTPWTSAQPGTRRSALAGRGRRHVRRSAGRRAVTGGGGRCGAGPTSGRPAPLRPRPAAVPVVGRRDQRPPARPRAGRGHDRGRAGDVGRGPVRAGLRDGVAARRRLLAGPAGPALSPAEQRAP